MCNCSSISNSICNQCATGYPCGCPPSYEVTPQPITDCNCCPSGYTYVNGICQSNTNNNTTPTIPCNSCVDTTSSDCILLPKIECLDLPANTTLTGLANYLCSDAFIQMILTRIHASTSLGTGFCQLVQNCPGSGSGTTPVLGPIVVTFP